ncbi:MAG TPA: hypothetical protein VK525_05645 [Candidatus Saccharimonadales bacterium]|nr:hypothetical protein [Candidatus Saccharimonadales bacterium]
MPIRISPDESQPSASIEIPLEKSLPDYDLERMEQPTPREVDAILVSLGFRDLIDDARGVLLEILADPPSKETASHDRCLDITHPELEIAQLTGAICSGDGVYLPGLWIVLRDMKAQPKKALPSSTMERIEAIVDEFVRQLQII